MYMNDFINNALANTNTTKKAERAHNIERHTANTANDNGANGKAFEIALQSVFSARTNYAKQGANDKTLTIDGKRVSVEIKSNGGRIDNIEKSDFVIYGFDICNSTTKNKRRVCDVIICPSAVFLDALEKCGAIKEIYHAHKVDGRAIQPSKRAWFEWVANYPVKYEMGKKYSFADFE